MHFKRGGTGPPLVFVHGVLGTHEVWADPNGLLNLGNNQWASTAVSGPALVAVPGSGGRGVLQSSAVEESNVDLTNALVELIAAQRNYQANAQTIKTQDAIIQTMLNLR
jgi:flagellar hook protein FlgE